MNLFKFYFQYMYIHLLLCKTGIMQYEKMDLVFILITIVNISLYHSTVIESKSLPWNVSIKHYIMSLHLQPALGECSIPMSISEAHPSVSLCLIPRKCWINSGMGWQFLYLPFNNRVFIHIVPLDWDSPLISGSFFRERFCAPSS